MVKLFVQNAPAILILIGAFISAGGAFWASIRQSVNITKLAESSTQLAQKNEEIARLQLEGANLVTGGDSFCEAGFQIFDVNGVMVGTSNPQDDIILQPVIIH